MMSKNHKFIGVADAPTIGRLLRSQDIAVLNRFDFFKAVNRKNGHTYEVRITGNNIVCPCKDSERGHTCKHEIAVARDLSFFREE